MKMRVFVLLGFLIIFNYLYGEKLTLVDAEKRAAKNSFEVKSKLMEEQSKQWEKKNAIANYLPKIDYGLTYLRMESDFVNNNSSPFNPLFENSFSHEITVTQPITNGGVEIFAIEIADHIEKAFYHSKNETVASSISEVREKYFDLISLIEAEKVIKKTVEWKKKNLDGAKIKLKAGSGLETDVLRWETELLTSENDLENAISNRKTAILSLYHAMGESVINSIFEVETDNFDDIHNLYQKIDFNFDGDVSGSWNLKSMEEAVKISEGYQDVALSAFLPKLNAFYNYSWPTSDDFAPETDNSTWNAGISLSIPIFYGFRNYTSYQKASFDKKQTEIQYQELYNNLKIGLESLKIGLKTSKSTVETSMKKVELMERQLDMVQKRYDLGGIEQSALLEISLGLQSARFDYINSLLSALRIETEIKKICGNLEVIE
ncbi:MAG: TolC family protein [Candidatus Delongbacteria bacterium]|nr:TolC family protein [Candidatus Delongbacteria bacterium]MBN2833867.1 TolC family protein [Candidatus Delongbacteria bacterium]